MNGVRDFIDVLTPAALGTDGRDFNIVTASLPEEIRQRLLQLRDQRISKDGVVIIKAQEFRSLDKNRAEALRRLERLVNSVAVVAKVRRPTKPTHGSVKRRLENKGRRAALKASRRATEA